MNSGEVDYKSAIENSQNSDVVIISVYSKVRSYQGTLGINEQQKELVRKIIELKKPVILISHGNPYVLGEFPEVTAYINNYGDTKFSELAVAEALFGEIDIEGKSPVSIPLAGIKVGDGIRLKKKVSD